MDKQKLICALDDLKCAEASVRAAFEDAESEREIRARRRTSEELTDCVKRLDKLLIALNWQSMAENYDVKLFAQRLKELWTVERTEDILGGDGCRPWSDKTGYQQLRTGKNNAGR